MDSFTNESNSCKVVTIYTGRYQLWTHLQMRVITANVDMSVCVCVQCVIYIISLYPTLMKQLIYSNLFLQIKKH